VVAAAIQGNVDCEDYISHLIVLTPSYVPALTGVRGFARWIVHLIVGRAENKSTAEANYFISARRRNPWVTMLQCDAKPVRNLMRDLEGMHGGKTLSEPFAPPESIYNPPHARNTLEYNCARLATAHLGPVKRRTGSAISAT
jgi:hypothetical protein